MPAQGSCGGAWFSTAGGIGLRCPKCGAENPEDGLYCGSCAAQMKELAPVERKDVMPEELPPGLEKVLSGRYVKSVAVLTLIVGALQMVEIVAGEASILDIVFGAGCIAAAIATLIILRRQKSRGGTDALRRHLSVGTPFAQEGAVASARAVSLMGVAMLSGFALFGAGFLVMAAVVYDGSSNLAWAIAAVMGVAILGTIALMGGRGCADVRLSREGIMFHTLKMNVTLSFKRSELSALELKGRVLRVALSNPPYGMFRQSRHILLGDAGERERFAQAVAAYGLLGPGRV